MALTTYRSGISSISIVLFIVLSLYSVHWYKENDITLQYILNHPELFDGKTIALDSVEIVNSYDNSFFIGQDGAVVEIRGFGISDYGWLSNTVSLVGIIRVGEGFIEAQQVHHHKYDGVRYLVSPIGLLVFLYFLFTEWKVTKKGMVER